VKILFDQNMPAPLRHALVGHDVATAYERGWHTLQNGELLSAAEAEGFELLREHSDLVVAAVATSVPGSYVELSIPPLSVPAHRDNA
jgi:hypothetical protein